jgi:hypothetical protein
MNEYLPSIDYTVASVIVFGALICMVAYNCFDEVKHIWKVKKLIK